MSESDPAGLIVRAARRASSRDEFMAWLLVRYQDLEQCDESQIAENLEIPRADVPKLALCLRPRPKTFVEDIAALAAKFNCDASKLANLVRLAEAAGVMQATEQSESGAGLLIAARKRNEHVKEDERQTE